MRIWQISTLIGKYSNLQTIGDNSFLEETNQGNLLLNEWDEHQFKFKRKEKTGSFYNILENISVNEKTKFLLEKLDINKENFEFLPIYSKEKTFYIINILKIIDCLTKIKLNYSSKSDSFYGKYDKYVFLEKEVTNNNPLIFKCYTNIKGRIDRNFYCTDNFKSFVEQNKLTGLQFIEVYNSKSDNYLYEYEGNLSVEDYTFSNAIEISLKKGFFLTYSNVIIKNSEKGFIMGLIRKMNTVEWIFVHSFPSVFHNNKWKIILDDELVE